ncbi:MAG: hypothetical protein ACI4RD_00105 [Kiritimatiellia bacterium]
MAVQWLCLAAIHLVGVTGSELRTRAFFDANNVKVGDPMVLTVDFIGEAEFKDLHPPALARAVDRKDWKVDDVSAKTDTFRDARRLTYRVRPMREGLIWFPALDFTYDGPDGSPRRVRSNAIPVHAKAGAQVAVEELGEAPDAMPQPPALRRDVADASVFATEDDRFRWRKALAHPTADAFLPFDFPEARMNEATCAIRAGNWARALKLYRQLEWRIGQTPEIEQGIVAALALRYENEAVELPVWRQVFRPVLRYGWPGRAGIAGGVVAVLAALFWLVGRGIRAVACVTIAVGCCCPAAAQGIFQQMEEQMNRMHRQLQQAFGGGGLGFGERHVREPVRIAAKLATDRRELQVGEPFEFILSLEYPKTASVGQIRLTPSESFGLVFTGQASNLTDGEPSNPSNVVKRLAVPARYDVPYRGRIAFSIEGMVSGRENRQDGAFSFTFSNSFRCDTDSLLLAVKPLPDAGQPDDFSGIVSEGLRVHETCDILRVETNDVVTITYRLFPNGYVPAEFQPKDVAFEWSRQQDREGRVREIEYRRYFVADGAAKTPELVISYYDPRTKAYEQARTGGTPLRYRAGER